MQSSSIWRLYADNILVQQGTYQLAGNSDTTLCFSANWRTFRLEAEPLNGFPPESHPVSNIERCGTLQSGQHYSLGQILVAPLDNNIPFYYTACRVVSNSVDPNLKSVEPTGWSSRQFTQKTERLTYHIDFQNTGNDTAFNVDIYDTLNTSSNYDLSSLELLGSDHDYNFEMFDGYYRVLHWRFNDILLPDSSTDEPGSHGFIEFSILADPNIQNGSVLANRAAIRFDNNPFVCTNSVLTTICETEEPAVVIQAPDTICAGDTLTCFAIINNGGSNPYIIWTINHTSQSINNDTVQFTGLTDLDTLSCRIVSNYLCAQPNYVDCDPLVIHVIPPPVIPSISFSSPYLISSTASHYQWYFNGNPIPGATSQSVHPIFYGLYQVETWDVPLCTAISQEFVYNLTGTSGTIPDGIELYPNPSDEYFYLEGITSPAEISLTDINAKKLDVEILMDKNLCRISVKTLPPAIYFVRIRIEENIMYKPVLVYHP